MKEMSTLICGKAAVGENYNSTHKRVMKQNDISNNLNHWDYIDRYSTWMYHVYQEYVGKKVFDVGAGMGRMVEYYIEFTESVVATDIFQHQVNHMNSRFKDYPGFVAKKIDVLEDALDRFENEFDTVICINVLEHLPDDYKAVENMLSLLEMGGHLILMVPAWQKLYCKMDENVGHYRRYDPGRLNDIAEKNKAEIVKHRYFNLMGIIPYWLKGKRKTGTDESFSSSLNENNSKIYNLASVILEPIERAFPPKFGLTEVMILKK